MVSRPKHPKQNIRKLLDVIIEDDHYPTVTMIYEYIVHNLYSNTVMCVVLNISTYVCVCSVFSEWGVGGCVGSHVY